jgi:glycosyltransferase involved in cell wall biosynthesis
MTFSIIIPTFNRPEKVARAIRSCFNQTYSEAFEVIVVNDGGRSIEVSSLPVKNNVSLSIIDINNSGVSQARNIGIKHASGAWICLLDDDDMFLPNHLNVLQITILKLQESKINWISTDSIQIFPSKTSIKSSKKYGALTFRDAIKWDAITTNTSCFRREASGEFPIKEKYLEDFEHRLEIIQNGGYFRVPCITSVIDSTEHSATNGEHDGDLPKTYLRRYEEIFSKYPQYRKYKNRRMAPWRWRYISRSAPDLSMPEFLLETSKVLFHLRHVKCVTILDLISVIAKKISGKQY